MRWTTFRAWVERVSCAFTTLRVTQLSELTTRCPVAIITCGNPAHTPRQQWLYRCRKMRRCPAASPATVAAFLHTHQYTKALIQCCMCSCCCLAMQTGAAELHASCVLEVHSQFMENKHSCSCTPCTRTAGRLQTTHPAHPQC